MKKNFTNLATGMLLLLTVVFYAGCKKNDDSMIHEPSANDVSKNIDPTGGWGNEGPPENKTWNENQGQCISMQLMNCTRPASKPIGPPPVPPGNIFSNYVENGVEDSIRYFFVNYDYSILWPELDADYDIDDYINATDRMVIIDNVGLHSYFCLIGPSSSSNQQIISNPIIALEFDYEAW